MGPRKYHSNRNRYCVGDGSKVIVPGTTKIRNDHKLAILLEYLCTQRIRLFEKAIATRTSFCASDLI